MSHTGTGAHDIGLAGYVPWSQVRRRRKLSLCRARCAAWEFAKLWAIVEREEGEGEEDSRTFEDDRESG